MERFSRHSVEPNHFERDDRAATSLLTRLSILALTHH
jgi:hypothetical protein